MIIFVDFDEEYFEHDKRKYSLFDKPHADGVALKLVPLFSLSLYINYAHHIISKMTLLIRYMSISILIELSCFALG